MNGVPSRLAWFGLGGLSAVFASTQDRTTTIWLCGLAAITGVVLSIIEMLQLLNPPPDQPTERDKDPK